MNERHRYQQYTRVLVSRYTRFKLSFDYIPVPHFEFWRDFFSKI